LDWRSLIASIIVIEVVAMIETYVRWFI